MARPALKQTCADNVVVARQEHRQRKEKLVLEGPRSPEHDWRRMRAIPVIGGSPGVIPGTRPDDALNFRRNGG
jgi:hypothetical protein